MIKPDSSGKFFMNEYAAIDYILPYYHNKPLVELLLIFYLFEDISNKTINVL